MTLKEFSQLYYDHLYKDSTVPVHAQPRKVFKESSANELTKTILAYFKMVGIEAWRQASEGRYLQEKKIKNVLGQSITVEKGRFIPRSKKTKGSGDISCILPPNGRRLEIEIKYGRDVQSDDQKDFQRRIEAMRAKYVIVKTWDGFWNDIGSKLRNP